MAAPEAADADAPPRVWASAAKVYALTPFQVAFEAGVAWMAQHRVTEELVRGQAGRARLFLEDPGGRHEAAGEELPLCQRCCARRGANVTLGFSPASERTTAAAAAAAASTTARDTCVVLFDYCRSYCYSSRLHLGGRVVIEVEVLDCLGNVVARPRTQPLMLCSKPTARASPVVPEAPEPLGPLASQLGLAGDGAGAAAAQAPQAADDGNLARQLAELEATLYGQLLNVRMAMLLYRS
eukprot:m51a1_g4272 hypothetical protein (239) ;mRNA; f:306008-306929